MLDEEWDDGGAWVAGNGEHRIAGVWAEDGAVVRGVVVAAWDPDGTVAPGARHFRVSGGVDGAVYCVGASGVVAHVAKPAATIILRTQLAASCLMLKR